MVAELRGHDEKLRGAVFSPDGTRILTTCLWFGTTHIWDSVPYRIRYAEREANAAGRDGGAIVKAWLEAVKAGTEKDFVVPPLAAAKVDS